MDHTAVTVNIALSDDFEGGGTFVRASSRSAPTEAGRSSQGFCLRPRTGIALVHKGGVEHAGNAVTRGLRYVLVAFFYGGEGPAPPLPMPLPQRTPAAAAAAAAVAAMREAANEAFKRAVAGGATQADAKELARKAGKAAWKATKRPRQRRATRPLPPRRRRGGRGLGVCKTCVCLVCLGICSLLRLGRKPISDTSAYTCHMHMHMHML